MTKMQDKVKAGYDKAAQAYQSGRDQFKNEKYLQKLTDLLVPNSTVLDVGCGSGKPVASFLVSAGHKVIGLDISEKQIELAKQNVPSASFKVRDMSALKQGEFAVDAIVSFYAIFHIPREEHTELLKKFNSFLTSGGLLLITMGSSAWQGNEQFFGVEMYWSHYGKETNVQIVQESGFEILLDEIDETGGEKHQVILARKIK
jgi:cyclopropane fatty-acyl-phospholipid synthase-like methyltransferase